MMKTTGFIACLLALCVTAVFSQTTAPDQALIRNLKDTDPRQYTGKLFGHLLDDTVLKKYNNWSPSCEPPGKLHAVYLFYGNDTWISVTFDKMVHQKRFNEHCRWDLKLLRKENISAIECSWDKPGEQAQSISFDDMLTLVCAKSWPGVYRQLASFIRAVARF